MLNIPSEIKSLFQRDGVYKNFKVHFPNGEATDFDNEKIQQESVVFTESLCSQQMFKFGLAEASQIEFTAIDVPNILGAAIDCALEIDCTSLGTAWNDQHPYDPNLPWLTPQGYNDGATFSSGPTPVTVSVGTGETLYILNYSMTFEYTPFHADTATPSNPTTVSGIKSADMLIAPSLAGNADQTTTVTFDEPLLRGTVNLTTGKFKQTQKFLDLSELTWTALGNNRFAAELPDDATPVLNTQSAGDFGYYCSHYFPVKESAVTSNNYCFCVVFDGMNPRGILYVRNVDYSTANAFTASLQNVKFVYGCTEYSGVTNSAYPPGFYASNQTKYIRGRMTVQSGSVMQSAIVEYYTALADRRRYFRIPYGRFIVNSCPRNHGQMYLRKITAFSNIKFNVEQYVNGQYPTKVVKINPYDWLEAYLGDMPFETSEGFATGTDIEWGMCNSSGTQLELNGLAVTTATSEDTIDFFTTPTSVQHPIGEYALKVHYEPSVMDKYSDHFLEKALASIPNGNFTYQRIGSNTYASAFAETTTAFAVLYGTFKPCYQIIIHYINDNDPDLIFNRFSKPIFIDSDKTYIVDLTKLTEFLYCADVPSGYSMATGNLTPAVSLRVCVPVDWQKTAKWTGPSTVNITDWATGVTPFNTQNAYSRSGTVDVYLKQLQATATPKCKIYNTLKINKPGLGDYYTYANAASPTKMAEAIMELTGQFLKVTRTSELAVYKMSDHQTLISVPNSDWSEFWWDENPIDTIGIVNVTLSEEESTGISIGTGTSVYVMDDNNILQNGYWTLAQANAALQGQFKSETAYANYTPVDLKMRGLPYLEAGDKIQLTAGDGATVTTYIMSQTIMGIQNLQTTATSVSGDPVSIVEEE